MPTELRIHTIFDGMNGEPVTMYECEHLTAGTYKLASGANLVSTGEHTCMLLCVHCVTHHRGEILADLVLDVLRDRALPDLMGSEWYEAMMQALEARRKRIADSETRLFDRQQKEAVINA